MSLLQDRLQCVIVHHASRHTIRRTVDSVCEAGVRASRVVVVDNSPPDQPDLTFTDAAVTVIRMQNRGYAAAVNAGVEALGKQGHLPITLVCTHEVILKPDALDRVCQALDACPSAAVTAPTLMDAATDEVWSTGGYLTPVLHLPRHHRMLAPTETASYVERDWLDGACTIYRTGALMEHRLDETFFLYFEETDLHTRLRRAGWQVLWVPDAIAHQSSSGIPPRLLGRNLLLFQARHFSEWSGRRAVAFEALRALARKAATRRGSWSSPRQIIEGWWEAERLLDRRRKESTHDVVI